MAQNQEVSRIFLPSGFEYARELLLKIIHTKLLLLEVYFMFIQSKHNMQTCHKVSPTIVNQKQK